MGLETGTYISDLNASNPEVDDAVSLGDDHLRLIKSTILASFGGVTGAVTSTHAELNLLDGATGPSGTGNLILSGSPTFTGTITAGNITAASGTITANTFTGSVAAANIDSGTLGDARIAESNVTQYETALTITKSQVSDFGSPLYSGDVVSTNLSFGSSDTTLARAASGQLQVENHAIFSQANATYNSARIRYSNGVEPGPGDDNDGDIWLVY